MHYLPTDFYALKALAAHEPATARDVPAAWRSLCGYYPPLTALGDALSALAADGLITVDGGNRKDGCLNPDTLIQVTDKGREAVTVNGMSRVLSSLRERAERKLELAFCERERPKGDILPLDREAFDEAAAGELVQGFRITEGTDGTYTLTVTNDDAGADDEVEDISVAAVTTSADYLCAALLDLLDVAEGLLRGEARTRKVALHGMERSLVLTFARASCEDGVSALHITAAPVRFNRARFVGKRDSELDYAQCGEPILSAYRSPDPSAMARALLPVAATAGHEVLSEEAADRIHTLHRALR